MSFPHESQEKLKQIRTLHSDFLRDTADVSEYLKYLSKLKDIKTIECHLAACTAISSAIIYSNVTTDLHHFSKCFTYLITCSDEVVRRSCLSLISLLAQKGQLETVLNFLLPLFKEKWTDRAQEMMLSFAFSFSPPAANYFRIFLPMAESLRKSKDELLSSTATDFILFMNNLGNGNKNGDFNSKEPKTVLMLRTSINFSKIHENFFSPNNNNFDEDDFIEDDNSPSPAQEPFVTSTIPVKKASSAKTNFSKPPRTTNSVRRKNHTSDSLEEDDIKNDDADYPVNNKFIQKKTKNNSKEPEPEPVPPPVNEPNYDEFDENTEPPPGKSLLCNSIDLSKALGKNFANSNAYDDNESKRSQRTSAVDSSEDSRSPRPSSKAKSKNKSKYGSGTSNIPVPSGSPASSRRGSIKKLNRYDDDKDDDAGTYNDNFEDEDTNDTKDDDRPTYKKTPKSAAKSKRSTNLSNSGSVNSSAVSTPTSSKRKSGSLSQKDKEKEKEKEIPLSELTSMLRNKDWEMQQKAVDILGDHLTDDPSQLSFLCKDIWLNLMDAVSSPRTMLAHQSFQLAERIFRSFSQTLCAQTSQWIQMLLNYTCSSHQFIAEDATDVLNAIAEGSPRSRVFSALITGLKHKNSIARGKSTYCLMCVIPNTSLNSNSTVKQNSLDEKELKAVIVNTAPLIRDTRVETRDVAKKLLKELSADERFSNIAKTSLSAQDYTEMKKMIEI